MLFANEREIVKGLLSDPLLAHVNADGTAHDWQESDHLNLRVPGGELDPHGRRGGTTYSDGRAKYSPEEVLQKIKAGEIDQGVLKHDDRFWPQDSRPGDGSNMTPEAQEWIKKIWNEKDDLLSSLDGVKKADNSWFNEGTGIEKGGFENAPQWLKDQYWKKDLEERRRLGLEPVVS